MSSSQERFSIREIKLKNVLSFGAEASVLKLNNLNVLIGANGSGKSNLIESISLLRAVPGDLSAVFRRGGGFGEWVWKGNPNGFAEFDFVLTNPAGSTPLRHRLVFHSQNQSYRLSDESVENERPQAGHQQLHFYYRYQQGNPIINVKGAEHKLQRDTVEADKSILAQRRDPDSYPEISYLSGEYERIRTYREWTFGRNSIFREPQKADMRNDRLEEDFSNLGLFLNRLRRNPAVKKAILGALGDLYDGFSDFDVSIEGGTVQVFFTEGNFTIPATRLSDGTLRYLCMLSILLDPDPPPVICIEEPELGLHPDVLPKLADQLVCASKHTQIIVTTHSDILVDALTNQPESVVVCEKRDGQTEMARLKSEDLAQWLNKYRLGQLWIKGQLGGTRW